jgi:6-phospho-beta-glucosidase
MKKIKIGMIGAGSTFTPQFAELLMHRREQLCIGEWVMEDVNAERLHIVADFTRKLIEEGGGDIKIRETTSIREAVTDADFVFTVFRVGGVQARLLDEMIPLKYGLIGQETTAPGGLAMGLRNVPLIVEVARAIEMYADPHTWLINLANPGGMLTEAVYQNTHCKTVGLCNWPNIAYSSVAEAYGVTRQDVFLRFVGLNHLNWAEIFVKGKKVGFEIKDKLLNAPSDSAKMCRAMLDMMSDDLLEFIGWPYMVFYDQYYYNYDSVVEAEMKRGDSYYKDFLKYTKSGMEKYLPEDLSKKIDQAKSRAEQIILQEQFILDAFKNFDRKGYEFMKQARGGGHGYAEAGIDVMDAIWNDLNNVQIVDYPNMGTVDDFPRNAVVQQPCLINGAGVWPISMGEIPHHMLSFMQAAKHYETLAVSGALTGSYKDALEALVASPFMNSFVKSKAVLDDLLVAHKAYLPNFSKAIADIEAGKRPY